MRAATQSIARVGSEYEADGLLVSAWSSLIVLRSIAFESREVWHSVSGQREIACEASWLTRSSTDVLSHLL